MPDNLLTPDQSKVNEVIDFISLFSSVIIGTVKNSKQPHISYAPFITHSNKFYVYVSSLAEHSQTLKNGSASLFFIENEQQAKTIFARTRLTINCSVSIIELTAPGRDLLLDRFEQRHGSTVKLLRSLPDFNLFKLTPSAASFVTGFGAAYNLTEKMNDLSRTNRENR